ncbi:serine/threonine-protein phosphatase pgam5-like [Tropilaelaps mercedesae]|uniref:Serine/threonine-protein phosphatase pgam5-like n=1 Tax=Tropilaelaps mercedesae TaxID=418985 RepID=A0A1V9XL06_9ACAR|nr:serine/threonine-protein phosphatase pgam5-like [Tropilaelaps mercedesae]
MIEIDKVIDKAGNLWFDRRLHLGDYEYTEFEKHKCIVAIENLASLCRQRAAREQVRLCSRPLRWNVRCLRTRAARWDWPRCVGKCCGSEMAYVFDMPEAGGKDLGGAMRPGPSAESPLCDELIVKVEQQAPPKISSKAFLADYDLNGTEKWKNNWNGRQLVNSYGKADDLTYDVPQKSRHVFFVRHGEYSQAGANDLQHRLTEGGEQQARLLEKRRNQLGFRLPPEMANRTVHSDLLREGLPLFAKVHAPQGDKPTELFDDGARMDVTFREYFYCAKPTQSKRSGCRSPVTDELAELVAALQTPFEQKCIF